MRTSRPPLIAAWILHRFGAAPETEAIAGDLLEHYQQGRSRLWYWREVTVAIIRGIWSEAQQHTLSVLVAIAMAWVLAFVWHQFVTPVYLLAVLYVLPHLQELVLLGLLLDGPLAVAMGWAVARCARRCPIPAVFGLVGSTFLVSAWTIWKNVQIVGPAYHFSVWRSICLIALLTALTLLGSGLLTGLPKRSIRTQ
jgi:hypothetical protein